MNEQPPARSATLGEIDFSVEEQQQMEARFAPVQDAIARRRRALVRAPAEPADADSLPSGGQSGIATVAPTALDLLVDAAFDAESPTLAAPPGPPEPAPPPPPPDISEVSSSERAAVRPPPPPLAATTAPGPQPATAPPPPATVVSPPATAQEDRPRARTRAWFNDLFDLDFLRTLPAQTAEQRQREVAFIAGALDLSPGESVLDLGCGVGHHAIELAAGGVQASGLDLSLPMLVRAADEAHRRNIAVQWIHSDMRELNFNGEFDAAYCFGATFGYFDEATNRQLIANIARALKPGGRLLLDVINRDYLINDLPKRLWWQGEGCLVLEEIEFNYYNSRLQVQRSVVLEEGRQLQQNYTMRAYTLHELGDVMHQAGFRVTEVSGGIGLRGHFFGCDSRRILLIAERAAAPL